MLEFPTITAATLGATIILQMALAMRTSMGRFKYKQSVGDGGKAAMITRAWQPNGKRADYSHNAWLVGGCGGRRHRNHDFGGDILY